MQEKKVSPLAVLMLMRGKTQQEVADFLGVRRETVSNWMRGKSEPKLSLDEWFRLAKFLDTPIDKLPRTFSPKRIEENDELMIKFKE